MYNINYNNGSYLKGDCKMINLIFGNKLRHNLTIEYTVCCQEKFL